MKVVLVLTSVFPWIICGSSTKRRAIEVASSGDDLKTARCGDGKQLCHQFEMSSRLSDREEAYVG